MHRLDGGHCGGDGERVRACAARDCEEDVKQLVDVAHRGGRGVSFHLLAAAQRLSTPSIS
eukprot:2167467-Rhodomonas_salina.3